MDCKLESHLDVPSSRKEKGHRSGTWVPPSIFRLLAVNVKIVPMPFCVSSAFSAGCPLLSQTTSIFSSDSFSLLDKTLHIHTLKASPAAVRKASSHIRSHLLGTPSPRGQKDLSFPPTFDRFLLPTLF